MGYMLPLRFIKVSNKRSESNPEKKRRKFFDVAICATRVVALMSTDIYQARRTISEEKKAGSLINACGTTAAKTAIFLDNGAVVASPLSVEVLLNAIEKSNQKDSARKTKRLRVYDMEDEEPNPDIDEDIPEMDAEDYDE